MEIEVDFGDIHRDGGGHMLVIAMWELIHAAERGEAESAGDVAEGMRKLIDAWVENEAENGETLSRLMARNRALVAKLEHYGIDPNA